MAVSCNGIECFLHIMTTMLIKVPENTPNQESKEIQQAQVTAYNLATSLRTTHSVILLDCNYPLHRDPEHKFLLPAIELVRMVPSNKDAPLRVTVLGLPNRDHHRARLLRIENKKVRPFNPRARKINITQHDIHSMRDNAMQMSNSYPDCADL